MRPSTSAPAVGAVRYFSWSYPEWWSVVLCWTAWAVMLRHGSRHAGYAAHHRMSFPDELASWMLMVVAMMLPLSFDALRMTAVRSLWARRHRAMAGFLAGYLGPWLALGVAAAALRSEAWAHTHVAAALGFVAAALWQRTRVHRRAVAACHQVHPLAPAGWRADLDCIRAGGVIGAACVRSSWPLMLACAFTGHDPIAMAGGMAVGVLERWSFGPAGRGMLRGTLALAGYYGLLAILEQAGLHMVH